MYRLRSADDGWKSGRLSNEETVTGFVFLTEQVHRRWVAGTLRDREGGGVEEVDDTPQDRGREIEGGEEGCGGVVW